VCAEIEGFFSNITRCMLIKSLHGVTDEGGEDFLFPSDTYISWKEKCNDILNLEC
jgi:hypothetical protein